MPIAQGHEHCGRYAQGRGGDPARPLVSPADDETGSLAWAETRIRIVPTDRRQALACLESAEGVKYLLRGER